MSPFTAMKSYKRFALSYLPLSNPLRYVFYHALAVIEHVHGRLGGADHHVGQHEATHEVGETV